MIVIKSALVFSMVSILAGCPAGGGEGWVVGSLWIENCKSGDPFSDGDFDLRADFFTGEPLFDSSEASSQQRSQLTVRLQQTSNNLEESNALVIQFLDLVKAAEAFTRREPLPITDDGLLPDATDVNTALRMQLHLYVTCPDNSAPMGGSAVPLEKRPPASTARDEECFLPALGPAAPCPALDEAGKLELDTICETASFTDRAQRATIERLLGAGDGPSACLYLCRLGDLERGSGEDLRGYEINFGDNVAAIFHTSVIDSRSVRLSRCARAKGELTGMFRFDLVRSRVAQPFP